MLDVTKPNPERKQSNPSIQWSNITLEPMWCCLGISLAISMFGNKNMYLHRACTKDLGHTEDECFGFTDGNNSNIELEGQRIVSSISVGSSFFTGFISSVMFLFLGPWSDNSGRRKPLILMSLLGMITSSTFLIIIQFLPNISTIWVVYAVELSTAIGGSYIVLMMTAMSYLGDICYKTGRCTTTLIGRNIGVVTGSLTLGCVIGSQIYKYLGFLGIFGISLLLEVIALIYVLVRVEDLNVSENKYSIFSLTLPLQAVKCVFKKREGSKRKNIFMMIFVPCLHSMMDSTESALNYLFLRNNFLWTEVEFGYYLTMRTAIYTTGILIIITLLKKKLLWKDKSIGMCSALSQISGSLLFMTAPNDWAVYGSNILLLFSRGAMVVERPVLNKQIKANEQGKVTCLTAVAEKIVVFTITPFANFIYSKTLYIFPGCFTFIVLVGGTFQFLAYYFLTENETMDEENALKKEENINTIKD